MTKDIFPIYVASKGRPESTTLRLLQVQKIAHTAVVEPQEVDEYLAEMGDWQSPRDEWPKLTVLPKSNQGIAFVRNYILEDARQRGLSWFWMLDDDINGFFLVEKSRLVRTPAGEVLSAAQRVFRSVGRVGQGALEYGQFAWSARKDHAIGYCDVAVCINVQRTAGLRYRKEMELKEDRDFTLQVLNSGWLTVRASHCAFAAPKNGSNAGGLSEVYAQNGREEEASKRMEKAWPGICRFEPKPDGRPDVKINWKAFRPPKP